MTKRKSTDVEKSTSLNWMGFPVQSYSIRDAMEDFDDPLPIDRRRIRETAGPRDGDPRPFAPDHSRLVEPLPRAPIHYRGALTGTTGFGKPAAQLPVDHFQKLEPTDILSDNIAARLKRDIQRELKMSEDQAVGIIGNADHESGGFGRIFGNLWQNGRVGEGAFGYMQWDGSRQDNFVKWAERNGLDPRSYEANFGFMEHEFKEGEEFNNAKERKSLADFYLTGNVDEATELLARGYLRPKEEKLQLSKRRAAAENAMHLPNYQSGGPYDHPPWRTPVPMPRPDSVGGKPWRY